MFHYDRGLKITQANLAIDITRRQPRGFISHAHADHMGPHELAYCTPATAAFYRHRLGAHRQVCEMPFGQRMELNGFGFTPLPAGHIFGAAMLLVENDSQSLLYTGDYRLRPSLTAGQAELCAADVLVMETTFGKSRYRFPSRESTWEWLFNSIETARREDRTPVIRAYTLGKSQEVTRALTAAGYQVMQHPLTLAISRLYELLGCPLGDVVEFDADRCQEAVVVAPPRGQKRSYLPLPARVHEIAVTGWALDRSARFRLGVDEAIPLSDHADFDELLQTVEIVAPQRIYCTHGDASFCEMLCELGHDARILGAESHQKRLF